MTELQPPELQVVHLEFVSDLIVQRLAPGTAPGCEFALVLPALLWDIEDFDIECSFDIDVFYILYRISISKVFDIEGHLTRNRRGHTIDIKCY